MAVSKYETKKVFNENEKGEKIGPFWAIVFDRDGVENWAVPNQFNSEAEAQAFIDEKLTNK